MVPTVTQDVCPRVEAAGGAGRRTFATDPVPVAASASLPVRAALVDGSAVVAGPIGHAPYTAVPTVTAAFPVAADVERRHVGVSGGSVAAAAGDVGPYGRRDRELAGPA